MVTAGSLRLWMRHEARPTERRAPIVPADARILIGDGVDVIVEDSPQRIFPISDYAEAGCRITTPGSWVDAPGDAVIVGLKELPDEPAALVHRHVFFGHAYKGQSGSRQLLHRFAAGGGTLLDLEYLVDARGHRLVAFGYWAGYVGAALGVLHYRGRLERPLRPGSKDALNAALTRTGSAAPPETLIIGAFGRCGRGAQAAFSVAGITPTCWGLAETRTLDRAAILGHDILINAVLITAPVPPFLTPAALDDPSRRLTVVSDVSCDVSSACNMLPIYSDTTTWDQPTCRLRSGALPLDIIAIDNLPSLLPRESSVAFSAGLLPHLRSLGTCAPPWRRCAQAFRSSLSGALIA